MDDDTCTLDVEKVVDSTVFLPSNCGSSCPFLLVSTTATVVFFKEEGNKLFREERWDQALHNYSMGMLIEPFNSVLAANRAMA